MSNELKEKLEYVKKVLSEADTYRHAVSVLSYDQETICPPKGMEEQGEVMAFLANQAFKLTKADEFVEAENYLYDHRDELGEWDKALADNLHRAYEKEKNITPEKQMEFQLVYNKAFVDWSEARKASDFTLVKDSLLKVKNVE